MTRFRSSTHRSSIRRLLSIVAVAAPLAIASSAAPTFAQTIDPAPAIQLAPAVLPINIPDPLAPAALPAAPSAPVATPDATPDPRQVECVAKIIIHEAANEPHDGRVAVAQVIRTRIKSGRFAADACAVAKQRGQFFNVDAYAPSRDHRWDDAVAIATDTLNGAGDDVAPGALFFHAARSPMPGRVRVTQIGGHVFYR